MWIHCVPVYSFSSYSCTVMGQMEKTKTQADNQRFYHVNTLCACGGSVQLQFIFLHSHGTNGKDKDTSCQSDFHVNTLCACGDSVQLQFIILHTGTVPKTLAYIIHILNHSTCHLTFLNMACKSKLAAIDNKQEEIILQNSRKHRRKGGRKKDEQERRNRKEWERRRGGGRIRGGQGGEKADTETKMKRKKEEKKMMKQMKKKRQK